MSERVVSSIRRPDKANTLDRVIGIIAHELQIEPGSRDHRVLAEKAETLSLAFPQEQPLLDLLRRSARILLKPRNDLEN